jgi:ferritin-like protein
MFSIIHYPSANSSSFLKGFMEKMKKATILEERTKLEKKVEELMDKIEVLEGDLQKAEKDLKALQRRCKHKNVPPDEGDHPTCPDCGLTFSPL